MLKKRYIKTRKVCKVSFIIPKKELPDDVEIETIHLVGDFNDWDETTTEMTKNSKGEYRANLELAPDSEFQYRYLINGETWYNDWNADLYYPNNQGGDNCVVLTISE